MKTLKEVLTRALEEARKVGRLDVGPLRITDTPETMPADSLTVWDEAANMYYTYVFAGRFYDAEKKITVLEIDAQAREQRIEELEENVTRSTAAANDAADEVGRLNALVSRLCAEGARQEGSPEVKELIDTSVAAYQIWRSRNNRIPKNPIYLAHFKAIEPFLPSKDSDPVRDVLEKAADWGIAGARVALKALEEKE